MQRVSKYFHLCNSCYLIYTHRWSCLLKAFWQRLQTYFRSSLWVSLCLAKALVLLNDLLHVVHISEFEFLAGDPWGGVLIPLPFIFFLPPPSPSLGSINIKVNYEFMNLNMHSMVIHLHSTINIKPQSYQPYSYSIQSGLNILLRIMKIIQTYVSDLILIKFLYNWMVYLYPNYQHPWLNPNCLPVLGLQRPHPYRRVHPCFPLRRTNPAVPYWAESFHHPD